MLPTRPAAPPHLVRTIAAGGDPFGTHRSVSPKGSLPQPAERVDNDFTRLFDGEMLIEAETLNIDAASFRQMEEASDPLPPLDVPGQIAVAGLSDPAALTLARRVLATVGARGKQH